MIEKEIKTQASIHELIANRWSGRAFDVRRPVEAEKLVALLEAARWAPSCYGDEPWRLLVCNKNTDAAAWETALNCLAEGNQSWAQNAPVLVLAVADTMLRNGKPNRWGAYDTGAAMMSLSIQATALGLMCHQMGGFDPVQATDVFNIPDTYTPMAMIAVGYQLSKEEIPADLAERELAARQRRELQENFFSGIWGNSYQV